MPRPEPVRIDVVGGGPGGLLFALLVKRELAANCHVRVFEQNPANNTYGWGVVFSGQALEFIATGVPDVFDALTQHLEVWDELTIVHRDQAIAVDGSTFSGISRQKLLDVLQSFCQRDGVDMHFDTRFAPGTQDGGDADLVVGADGVNSVIRDTNDNAFQTRTTELNNRFIWYGTSRVFDSLSLIFRQNSHGSFVAHTYRYSPDMSTFLVECDAATFESAGLADMSTEQSISYCEKVFAADLKANALQSNNSVWRRFPNITNTYWHRDNAVLIGDALRTVHFSIGSGTRTAMQDAVYLADALKQNEFVVADALAGFVAARKPGADKLLEVANASIDWYEDFGDLMSLSPWEFAWSYMTRGGRVRTEQLAQRSPRFTAACKAGGVIALAD